MRWTIRIFFRTLRIVLVPFMLLWEIVTTPKGIVRPVDEQQRVDAQARNLVLYQFRTCPFCIKVRCEIRHWSLNIELRDAQHDEQNRTALLQGGGMLQVPCLQIVDEQGRSQWLYESGSIIAYLQKRFSAAA